jgi:hypothetical protein
MPDLRGGNLRIFFASFLVELIMKMKVLILFAAAGLSIAAAKSYDIVLGSPATIGNQQLAPGEYRLTWNQSTVTLMDTSNGKTVETATRVETAEKKFDHTAILSREINGTEHINEIQLGGSRTRLEFNP